MSGHRYSANTYDNEQLVMLCNILLPDDPSLVGEVRLAIDQPDIYWATIQPQRRLQWESATAPPHLPWMALLNGLLARGRLDLLDWRAEPAEVMAAIDGLLRERPPDAHRWDWVDQAECLEASTEDFLEAIGQRLQAHGLVLADFPLSGDMYPIGVINADWFPAVQQQSALTGYGEIEPFGMHDAAQEAAGQNHKDNADSADVR